MPNIGRYSHALSNENSFYYCVLTLLSFSLSLIPISLLVDSFHFSLPLKRPSSKFTKKSTPNFFEKYQVF